MAPKEPKISKQAAAGTTTDITLIIPETLKLIREAWKCYMPERYHGSIQDYIVDQLWYNKTQENITYKKLGW